MKQLIAALGDNIKPAGRDKWVSKCVVHNDKDWAMSIELKPDNAVVAHCFACGANGLDLYNHLRLDLDELFGGKKNLVDDSFVPQKLVDQYHTDKLVIAMHKAAKEKGEKISLVDNRRSRLAEARVVGLEAKYPDIKNKKW